MIDRPALRTLIGKRNLVGCEIGVGEGINALQILRNLDVKKLYLIDPYERYKDDPKQIEVMVTPANGKEEVAKGKLAPYADKIVWIKEISSLAHTQLQTEELDFIYIDGNHSYKSAKEDILNYFPKVKIGGLISGDDYNHPMDDYGVKKAVDEAFGDTVVKKKRPTLSAVDWWITR